MLTRETVLAPLPADDVLIRRAHLSKYLPIAPQTAARWASEGRGPEFIKIGQRLVAYRAGDLRRWLEEQSRSARSVAA